MTSGVFFLFGAMIAFLPQVSTETLIANHSVTLIAIETAPINRLQVVIHGALAADVPDFGVSHSGQNEIAAETLRLELLDQFPELEVQQTAAAFALGLWVTPEQTETSLSRLLAAIEGLSERKTLRTSFGQARANIALRRQRRQRSDQDLLQRALQSINGDTESLNNTFEALHKRFEAWPRQTSIKVIIAGRDLKNAKSKILEAVKRFVDGSQKPSSAETAGEAKPLFQTSLAQRRVLVVERPGETQLSAILFQPRSGVKRRKDWAGRIVSFALARLRYGVFGQTIRNQGGQLTQMPNALVEFGIAFRCAPGQLLRIVRALDQLWQKTKRSGLPRTDVASARAQLKREIRDHFSSTKRMVELFAKGGGSGFSGDRLALMLDEIDAISHDQINGFLQSKLARKPLGLVFASQSAGGLMSVLKQWPNSDSVVLMHAAALP